MFSGARMIDDKRERYFTAQISNEEFNFYKMFEFLENQLKKNGIIEDFSINQSSLEYVFIQFSKLQDTEEI